MNPFHLCVHCTYTKILSNVVLVRIFNRLLDHALSVDTACLSGTLLTHLLGLRSWMESVQLNYPVTSGRQLD